MIPEVSLGDVASAIRGVSFPAAEAARVEFTGSIPCLTTAAVKQGVDWAGVRHIPASRVPDRALLIRPGDILVSTTNSREKVGRAVLLDTSRDATFGAFVAVVRPGSRIEPRYLAHWMSSPQYFEQAHEHVRQTTGFANLNTSALLKLKVPLPPLEEQRRITARLTAQLAAVTGLHGHVTSTSNYLATVRSRVLGRAFHDIVPLTIKPVDEAVPDGWRWHLLTDLARLESGHTPSRGHPEWWGGEIPWIQLADIRAADGTVIRDTAEWTNAEGIAHSAARVLPVDTVVMSRTASVGFVARMGREMATSQDFVNWVCGADLDARFLMHLLIRAREYLRSLSSGAVHKTVYYPTVKALRVCVPPKAEQLAIADKLEARLDACDRARLASERMRVAAESLPSALLREAFAEVA